MKTPKVSFVICTLNCRDFTERCLRSIRAQDYPQNKIEIIVVDSYSTDGTIEIAKQLGARVILTKKKGYMEGKGMPKSLGCSKAKGEIIITIDSDNALVEKDWIRKMIFPITTNSKIDYSICRMAVVKSDNLANQYLSFVGTDPFAIYASIDPQLTYGNLKLQETERYSIYHNTRDNFLINGGYYTAFRRKTLEKLGGYSRDVDVTYNLASKKGGAYIAIAKNAHLHHLITKGISDFYRKKKKWGRYYFLNPQKERSHTWSNSLLGRYGKLNFIYQAFTDFLIFPALFTSIIMFFKYKNKAWLLHPLMKFITVTAYFQAFLSAKLSSRR